MEKSFAELKRDLQVGKELKCLYHALRKEREGQINKISKVQSNAICTEQERNGEIKNVYLDFPKSSNLVSYVDNIFSFFQAGFRDLTAEEEKLMEEMKNLVTEEERNLDIYTDSNIEYWRRKSFAEKHNCEYLLGFEEKQGKKYDFNTKKIRDNKVRGDLLFSFEII